MKQIFGAATQKEFKRARGTAAVTTQTQALAALSLQVRKGNTWPLGAEEDQGIEEGRFWLAKIEGGPLRLGGTMAFAGQVFKGGWVMAKAKYCSLVHGRSPETAKGRVHKLLSTGTFPSLNRIIRMDSSVALVVNSKPKSKKNQAMGA